MMNRLVILDIRKKKKDIDFFLEILGSEEQYISLTPYSSYILESLGFEFSTFRDEISTADFHHNVIDIYDHISKSESFLKLDKPYLLRDLARYVTYEHFLNSIKEIVSGSTVKYITDCESSGLYGALDTFLSFDEVVRVSNTDEMFYNKNKIYFKINHISLHWLKNKISCFFGKQCSYQKKLALNYFGEKSFLSSCSSEYGINYQDVEVLSNYISTESLKVVFKKDFSNLTKSVDFAIEPFTFLSGLEMYKRYELYKANAVKKVFFQHGSYVNEDFFLRYNEVYPADVNVVFNEYTKELFESYGADSFLSLKSSLFNRKIRKKKKEYDYVYITYCTQYTASGTFVGSRDYKISPDASDLMARHMAVCKLFGEKYKDKKLCIKLQPHIAMGMQNYVPLLEVSQRYDNVSIVFVGDLFSIVEKSKFILSDYYSSEFCNHDLVMNKNILMFNDIVRVNNRCLEEIKGFITIIDSVDDLDIFIDRPRFLNKNDSVVRKYTSFDNDFEDVLVEVNNVSLGG
ncbi:hypothetical protein H4F20_11195 [Vibrio sp. 16]|uniref:hypothetical protein n=1 Tax=Vibrio sp. 16 TaxID=391586 RepID=UPI002FEF7FCE